jgi:hypothetical protein
MTSHILWQALKLSSKGGLTRFLFESFITPSLYPYYFRSSSWTGIVRDLVVKQAKYEPRQVLEIIEKNVRFRTIARKSFLQQQYQVSPNIKARLLDCIDAPTRATVISGAFPEVTRFKYLGDEDARRRELVTEANLAKRGSELDKWTIEDILESCGCYVHGTSAFNTFCESEGVYDLFTDEYVEGLAEHLKGRKLIVEVGAGSGRLSHLLRRKLGSRSEIIATDSGSWSRMRGLRPVYPVVKCDYSTALSTYNPDAIITSWMPMNQDWTSAFRKKESCQEYILIGNPDSCGKLWDTWGTRSTDLFDQSLSFLKGKPVMDNWPIDIFEWMSGSYAEVGPDFSSEHVKKEDIPPYETAGFRKIELNDLSRLQLSRYDRTVRSGNSRTISFVRS